MPATKFWPSLSVNSKNKNCNPYFIVIMITVLIMNVIFWMVNFKTQNYSGGQNKVGQCFFANVNLLVLSMVTMKIFIYLL
jgi:hypothetical protein